MIRRTCACGARIVVADLDGWTIWIDDHQVNDGMFDIVGGKDVPRIVVDPQGQFRRHACDADQRHVDLGPATPTLSPGRIAALAARNERAKAEAAAQATAAARHVLAAGTPLTAVEHRAAMLRLAHPTLTVRELAAIGGMEPNSCSWALSRVRRHARRLNSTGAAA